MGMLLRRHGRTVNAVETNRSTATVLDIPKEAEEESKVFTLNKTEVNRLPKDKLVELATENGIEDVESKSGVDLKKELIAKFNL